MNVAVYNAARRAGCSPREAEVLATYVLSNKMAAAAQDMGISEHTAKIHMARVLEKLDVPHAAAAVAKVLTAA